MRAKTTLRVYDSKKEGFVDRYSLYYPTPKAKQKDWLTKGATLDFSFSEDQIITCCHTEIGLEVPISVLGKRVKIDTLPKHVQDWIAKEQAEWDLDVKCLTD